MPLLHPVVTARVAAALCGFVGLLGAAASCSSFGSDEAAGVPADDAAAPDAPLSDAAERDDAGSAGEGGCTPGLHVFCDDFDDGPLGERWTTKNVGAPAELALDQARAWSAPRSLRASLGDFDTGYVKGYLEKRLDGSLGGVTCSTKLYVEKLPAVGEPNLLTLTVQAPVVGAAFTSADLIFSFNADGTHLTLFQSFDGAPGFAAYPLDPRPLPVGRWMEVTVTLDATTRAVGLRVDGVEILSSAFQEVLLPNAFVTLRVGLFDADKGDGSRVYFDDVACDTLKP